MARWRVDAGVCQPSPYAANSQNECRAKFRAMMVHPAQCRLNF